MPKQRAPLLAAIALACACALAACSESGAAGSAAAPPATEVGVVTLKAQPLALKTELAGRTVAAQTAEIRPQVTGIVRERLFTEGGQVKQGQALYQLDAASYEATVASAQASVARAESTLRAAELKASRQAQLLAADAGTRQDAEDAEVALLQARADLKTAQATLTTARIDLDRTVIRSPISGRVDTSGVTAGALVTADQTTALTTVQQLDPMWVDIPQSSADMLKLRRQLSSGALKSGELGIHLVLEDGTNYAHAGQLQVSGVTVSSTTGAVTLRAKLPNPEGLLLPGMYVRAVIDQAQDPAAVLAPQAGISRNTHGDAQALVVAANGQVEQRAVSVAEAVNNQWRVTQGLQAGDRLIVEGTSKVRPGQIVHAVPATGATAQAAPPAASAASAATAAASAAPGATLALR